MWGVIKISISSLKPIILLDKPQLGENIGMAARAMLNCGLSELRLIAPRDGWPNSKASEACVGANIIIDHATAYDDLSSALADIHVLYATSGRPRGLNIPALEANIAMDNIHKQIHQEGKRVGILFGGERSGLDNDALTHAQTILYFPLNPDFKSLNLSHAVMLVAWEWLKYTQKDTIAATWENWSQNRLEIANHDEIDNLYKRLMEGAEQGGFLHTPALTPHVLRNVRMMLTKAQFTSQEVRTFHGLIRALRAADPYD